MVKDLEIKMKETKEILKETEITEVAFSKYRQFGLVDKFLVKKIVPGRGRGFHYFYDEKVIGQIKDVKQKMKQGISLITQVKMQKPIEAQCGGGGLTTPDLLRKFNKAIKLNPNNAETWCNRGGVFENLGKFEQALKDFDKALKLTPDLTEAWLRRGIVLLKLRKHERAIESFNKVIWLESDNVEAWHMMGDGLEILGKYEKAVESYDKSLNLNSRNFVAWNNRGVSLEHLGKYEEAIQSYEKAIELRPLYTKALLNLVENISRNPKTYRKLRKIERSTLIGFPGEHEVARVQRWFGSDRPHKDSLKKKQTDNTGKKVSSYLNLIKGQSSDIRTSIVWALGNIRDPRAVKTLISVLKSDVDAEVRRNAVEALGKIGARRAVEPLIAVLRDDDDEVVRVNAAKALGEIKSKKAVESLITILKDTTNKEQQNM